MTKENKKDNEVYILGSNSHDEGNKTASKKKYIILSIVALLIIAIGAGIYFASRTTQEDTADYYFEPEETIEQTVTIIPDSASAKIEGYIEVLNDTINDVPLNIYIPHNATMSLALGMPDQSDTTIVFTAMAADIRGDNQQIVGDFVLSGNKLSRGIAKKGFCAIIDNTVSIGMGDETPLLQQAIDKGGSFFRQYPLVSGGQLIENKPKNKSYRRALAIRNDQVIMVESKGRESFHDFSQALIDLGVTDAIYLVGGTAYGWYYTKDRTQHEFGKQEPDLPETISYIIWRIK